MKRRDPHLFKPLSSRPKCRDLHFRWRYPHETSRLPCHDQAHGPICNLDCKYCFYLEKETLYPGQRNWAMSHEVLEPYIRQYIQAQDVPRSPSPGRAANPPSWASTSSAASSSSNRIRRRQAHRQRPPDQRHPPRRRVGASSSPHNNFLIGLSIDGPRELHDATASIKAGQPTFDAVMRGLELLKKHGVEFNTLTVVNRHNSYTRSKSTSSSNEIGTGFMQFIPLVERDCARPLAGPDWTPARPVPSLEDSAEVIRVVRRAAAIRQIPLRHLRRMGPPRRRPVLRPASSTSRSAIWFGHAASPLRLRARPAATALAVEHNGDLYSCDHFVYPELSSSATSCRHPLAPLVASPQQRQFGNDKRDTLPRYCRECDVRFACNGECPKHRFITTPDGEPGLNYLCAGYKHFFNHIAPYMEFMAEELKNNGAPANVMSWIEENSEAEGY